MLPEREEIIRNMCLTYRHDYELKKHPDDPDWVAGMTDNQRKMLWTTMAQIFDNDIAPLILKYKEKQ